MYSRTKGTEVIDPTKTMEFKEALLTSFRRHEYNAKQAGQDEDSAKVPKKKQSTDLGLQKKGKAASS